MNIRQKKIPGRLPFQVVGIFLIMTVSAEVRYKMVFFDTGIKDAYEALYGAMPDTVPVLRHLDSLTEGNVCHEKSERRIVDCYSNSMDYKSLPERECCLIRTKGKAVLKLTDSLSQMRIQYEGLNNALASGRINESIVIRENTYTSLMFFNSAGRFWKYEVTGNRYRADRMAMVLSEADSLRHFMQAKYGAPVWKARRGNLVPERSGDTYFANWEFKEYIMYLVINATDSLYAAREVVMSRPLATAYEREMMKQGKDVHPLIATPK